MEDQYLKKQRWECLQTFLEKLTEKWSVKIISPLCSILSILCLSLLHNPFMVAKYTNLTKNVIKYLKPFLQCLLKNKNVYTSTEGSNSSNSVQSLCWSKKGFWSSFPLCIRSSCQFHLSNKTLPIFRRWRYLCLVDIYWWKRLGHNWHDSGDGVYILLTEILIFNTEHWAIR